MVMCITEESVLVLGRAATSSAFSEESQAEWRVYVPQITVFVN